MDADVDAAPEVAEDPAMTMDAPVRRANADAPAPGRVEVVPIARVRFSQWTVSATFSKGGSIREFDERKFVPPFGVRLEGSGDVLLRDNRRVVAAKLAGRDRIHVTVHGPRDALELDYRDKIVISFAWPGSFEGRDGVFRAWARAGTALAYVAMRCATQRGGPGGRDFPLDGHIGVPVITCDAQGGTAPIGPLAPVDTFVFDFSKVVLVELAVDSALPAIRAEADAGRIVFLGDGGRRNRIYTRRSDVRQLLAAHGNGLVVTSFAFAPDAKILAASADEPPEYDVDDPDVQRCGIDQLIEQDREIDDNIATLEEERWREWQVRGCVCE